MFLYLIREDFSVILMKAKKSNFSEWYTEITNEAELCDLRYNVKGFVVFMPNSVMTMKEMYRTYEQELEAHGHKPALFPAVIPESNFKKEGEHVEGFVPQVFWIREAGGTQLEERLALRPTSETAMYKMYSLWIQGVKDLPLKIYQSCQVWRYETKATRPFIRSREFYWIEAHDAFATKEEAEAQVREDMEMAENVLHKQFGIPFIFFQRPEWDKFPGAVHTYAADTLMPDGKVIQQPSTHLLGQNFAKAFDVKFQNEKGEKEYVWQTCYGPAISRIYASLISIHGDDKGLVLPFRLAPVQIVIVPILGKDAAGNEINEKCKKLEETLKKEGFRVKADFSENTPGFKYNYWELRGVPVRIEVGVKEIELKHLTVVRRDTGRREEIGEEKLLEWIKAAEKDILSNLIARADKWFNGLMWKADTMEQLGECLKKGGFTAVNFCSINMDGEPCAAKLKEELHADVRGIRYGRDEKPPSGAKCIVCGKPATCVVYVARQY